VLALHDVIVSASDTVIKRLFDHYFYRRDWQGDSPTACSRGSSPAATRLLPTTALNQPGCILWILANALRREGLALIARCTPLAFHKGVNRLRGRHAEDTFPTRYLVNCEKDFRCVCRHSGFVPELVERHEGRPEYLRLTPFTYYGEHWLDCTLAQHLQQLPPLLKGEASLCCWDHLAAACIIDSCVAAFSGMHDRRGSKAFMRQRLARGTPDRCRRADSSIKSPPGLIPRLNTRRGRPTWTGSHPSFPKSGTSSLWQREGRRDRSMPTGSHGWCGRIGTGALTRPTRSSRSYESRCGAGYYWIRLCACGDRAFVHEFWNTASCCEALYPVAQFTPPW
jgi:hypothetical protein